MWAVVFKILQLVGSKNYKLQWKGILTLKQCQSTIVAALYTIREVLTRNMASNNDHTSSCRPYRTHISAISDMPPPTHSMMQDFDDFYRLDTSVTRGLSTSSTTPTAPTNNNLSRIRSTSTVITSTPGASRVVMFYLSSLTDSIHLFNKSYEVSNTQSVILLYHHFVYV